MRVILCSKGHEVEPNTICPTLKEKFICKKCKMMLFENEVEVVEFDIEKYPMLKVKGLMTKENVVNVLRDTYWFGPIPIGVGGKVDIDGHGNGYPGTGMRRPGGALHGMPETHRNKLLRELVVVGWITKTEDDRYIATAQGKTTLEDLDVCKECGTVRSAYKYESTYRMPTYVLRNKHLVFYCKCRYEEHQKRAQSAINGFSNCQSSGCVAIHPKI